MARIIYCQWYKEYFWLWVITGFPSFWGNWENLRRQICKVFWHPQVFPVLGEETGKTWGWDFWGNFWQAQVFPVSGETGKTWGAWFWRFFCFLRFSRFLGETGKTWEWRFARFFGILRFSQFPQESRETGKTWGWGFWGGSWQAQVFPVSPRNLETLRMGFLRGF